jgi:nucleotide-binding universal stress UspA family protein
MEIIDYATKENIDMVVIGTHGRSGLMHILMGSIAERVVRLSPCPVLTVKPEGHQFVTP